MKNFIILLFCFCLTCLVSFSQENIINKTLKGLVKSVEFVDVNSEAVNVKQNVEILILNGELKGKTVFLDNIMTGNPYYDINLKKGNKVILHTEIINDEYDISIENIDRSSTLILLSIIFIFLLIYVGRKKGLNSLISILITGILILNFLSPAILNGINPVLVTLFICLLSTIFTMYLVGGFNRKSTSATIGCMLSIIVASGLALLTIYLASLNGFVNEHTVFLYAAHPELNFIAIIVSTIILATLGAVMDVSMSIASTINEIYTIDNTKTSKELFRSGMNVGKDIIGTMANTLILVYLGASLPLILLTSNINLQNFINLNQVVTEISSALIGSIAIVLCVPFTAYVSSKLIKQKSINYDFDSIKD